MLFRSFRSFAPGTVLSLLLSAFPTLSVLPASAAVLRVKANAPGPAHDGKTWAAAFLTVQAALDAAQLNDEIWVAAGAYPERITVVRPLGLYGGFAGTEATRDARNPAANVTVLDGGAAGTVVTLTAEAAGATLDGFTVRNGLSEDVGGIDCAAANAVIARNTVTGNRSRHITLAFAGVGGVRVTGSGTKVLDNLISGNTSEAPAEAVRGGGVRVEASDAQVTGNRITGNTAIGLSAKGGGLFVEGRNAVVRGNTVSDNQAVADATFIIGLTTVTWGAGAYVGSNEARVEGNAFTGNYGKARAEFCQFGCSGAGEVSGGGLYVAQDALDRPVDIRVADNLMAGNRLDGDGPMRGGLFIGSVPAMVRNNTISGNGPSSAGEGSGVAAFTGDTGPLTLANNVIAYNGEAGGGPGVLLDAPNVVFHHNDVFGNVPANFADKPADPAGANSNISADPLFADRAAGNYHLAGGSPALDRGDSALVAAGETDLDGHDRILGPAVDMGAYERPQGVTVPDAILALKAAGGLASLDPADVARLNAVTGAPEAVDIFDAIRLARRAAGLDQ